MLFLVRARCSPITGRVSGSVTRETMCGGVAFFCGEQKAHLLKSRRRGPATDTSRRDVEPEGPAELQQRLSRMSIPAVQDFYQYTHSACHIFPGHFPSARAIQELVQPGNRCGIGAEPRHKRFPIYFIKVLSQFAKRPRTTPVPTARMSNAAARRYIRLRL